MWRREDLRSSILKLFCLMSPEALVVFDPVSSYMGTQLDGFRNTQVRAVLDPISELADSWSNGLRELGGQSSILTIWRRVISPSDVVSRDRTRQPPKNSREKRNRRPVEFVTACQRCTLGRFARHDLQVRSRLAFSFYCLAGTVPMRLGLPLGATLVLPKLVGTLTNAFFKVVHVSHSGCSSPGKSTGNTLSDLKYATDLGIAVMN